jgi:hypothetical protein
VANFSASFDFSTGADYTLTNTELAGGLVRLTQTTATGLTFTQAFAADTGFTYDSNKAEFSGGTVRQKAVLPSNCTFYADYENSVVDAVAGGGTLTGTPTGSPTISGGGLVMTGGAANKYVTYDGTSNADGCVDAGCFNVGYTPNYSGTPATSQIIVMIAESGVSTNNQALFQHTTSGNIRVTIKDSAGVDIINTVLGVWAPTSGTTYELEFNWSKSGATTTARFMIDGVIFGGAVTGTGARSSTIDAIRVGADESPVAGEYTNHTLKWLAIYTAAQHTANYTPTGQFNIYQASQVTLPSFSYQGPTSITAYTNFQTTETAGAPRYTIKGKYWNGSAWADTSNTYATASSAATIAANIATLTGSGDTSLAVTILFTDSNSGARGTVDNLVVTYSGGQYNTTGTAVTIPDADADELLTFAVTGATTPSGTSIKYGVVVAGTLKYYNGSAWADSNGSAAQLNTAAEVNTNAEALLSGTNRSLTFHVLLTSDGINTPSLSQIDITYRFGGVGTTPATCEIWGYIKGLDGVGVGGVTLTFSLVRSLTSGYAEASGNIINPIIHASTNASDDPGYFEQTLIRSSAFQVSAGSTQMYQVTIPAADISNSAVKFVVPDATSRDITDLL